MAKIVTTSTTVKIGEELLIEYKHNNPEVSLSFLDEQGDSDVEVILKKEDIEDLISELADAKQTLWPPPKDILEEPAKTAIKEIMAAGPAPFPKSAEALEEPAPKTGRNGKEAKTPA